MMDLSELNAMLDKVNKMCTKVNEETTEIERAKNLDIDFAYRRFSVECGEMIVTMCKAGLKEFFYPTSMKGTAYGTTLYFVLTKVNDAGGYHRFCESGRIRKWTTGILNEDPFKADIVNWYFHKLDKEKFELAFKDAIIKATRDKVDKVIERNEKAKEK